MGSVWVRLADQPLADEFVRYVLSQVSYTRSAALLDCSGKRSEETKHLRECNLKAAFCFSSLLLIQQTFISDLTTRPKRLMI